MILPHRLLRCCCSERPLAYPGPSIRHSQPPPAFAASPVLRADCKQERWTGLMDEVPYQNTPTVVVVLVPLRGGLLMIRRALVGDGQGQVALPGGYQMLGQTWQEAGAAEVLEETGVVIDPAGLRALTVETTPDRRRNLLFCQSAPLEHAGGFVHDAEVSEVLIIHEPVETAFALHTRMVRAFFGLTADE